MFVFTVQSDINFLSRPLAGEQPNQEPIKVFHFSRTLKLLVD